MATRTVTASRLVSLVGSAADTAPAYRGLADGIRLLLADGRLPPGVRLPSERDLTAALGLSRTTITRAYAVLRDAGYLVSRQGSGSVTALPGPEVTPSPGLTVGVSQDADVLDLTCAAMPAPPGFALACEAAVAALPAHLATLGYHRHGLPELRAAVAERYSARGLPTDADQVMITTGALAGLAATCRALLATGDRVLMESPTYPNAIETVRRSGARPVSLPMEAAGWDPGAMAATLRQTAPRAAYLIPDFQNPTGALMTEDQRREAAAALQGTRTLAIVDEAVIDLSLTPGTKAPRPFAAFHGPTITLGGASKTYWGGLRIGWLRASREPLSAIADARLSLDLSAPVLEQLVMLQLLPRHEEIAAARRKLIADRCGFFTAALREHLPQWEFQRPSGGMCLWARLPEAASTALVVAAERHGVLLAPGSAFAVEGGLERFVRLPFAHLPEDQLVEAARRLAVAWGEALTHRSAARGGGPRLVA